MNIFNNVKLNCDNEKTDEINSLFSYKMTECFFNSIGKTLPKCKYSFNIENVNYQDLKICIKNLEGDAWTTFINFQSHIDNLCFFHKTLIWEKSSEFLFSKMLNSTLGILSELSSGSTLAKRILQEQEKFSSQLKDNMTDTLEEFKKIQNYFESFEKLEAKIKNDMDYIENKISKNNKHLIKTIKKLSNNLQYIDGFFFSKNGEFVLKFYLFLFIFIWIYTFNRKINYIKFKLYLLIILFIIIEKSLFKSFLSKDESNKNKLDEKDIIELEQMQENTSYNTNKEHLKEKYEIFENLKSTFATVLNSTFPFDNMFYKDNIFNFKPFDVYFYYFSLYIFRTICFIILNIICSIQKNSSITEDKKSNYERYTHVHTIL